LGATPSPTASPHGGGGVGGGVTLFKNAVTLVSLLSIAYTPVTADECKTPQEIRSERIGVVCAWISAVCYVSSRIPQIWKNYQRGSTEGLSFVTFFLTVCSNVSYASSIFLFSTQWSYLQRALPYLVGSLGTLFFDFVIWGQFFYFGTSDPPVESVEDDNFLKDDNDTL
jgi:uncharacterized protein with PQ loop repeat